MAILQHHRTCQSPIEKSLLLPVRDVTSALSNACLCFVLELAWSSAAELVRVAQPRCGGPIMSDISNGESGDICIGDLHAPFAEARLWNVTSKLLDLGFRRADHPLAEVSN